jgi:dTDP-4-dehydrorhamnose reductase
VALICGRGALARKSASEGIASRLIAGESVTLYDDEWRTPIDPDSIADAIRCVIARPEATGLFHIGGAERLSRYDLGLRTAEVLGLPAALIRRASQASHQGAPRPVDVSLDITRARTVLRWTPRPLDEALRATRTC